MVRHIPLTKGKFAYVDDCDFEILSQFRWRAKGTHRKRDVWYAVTGASPILRMHRMIMSPPDKLTVDHIDGDGLNNTRANLRVCTQQANSGNAISISCSGTSKYRGVSYASIQKNYPWRAVIGVDGRAIHIGLFATEEEAAHAYDGIAREWFGDYARLNFPQIGERAARPDQDRAA